MGYLGWGHAEKKMASKGGVSPKKMKEKGVGGVG